MGSNLVPDKELVKDINYTTSYLTDRNLCMDKLCPFMLIQLYMDLKQKFLTMSQCARIPISRIWFDNPRGNDSFIGLWKSRTF